MHILALAAEDCGEGNAFSFAPILVSTYDGSTSGLVPDRLS